MSEKFKIKAEDMPGLQLKLLVGIFSRLQTLEEFLLDKHFKNYSEEERKAAHEEYLNLLDENIKSISTSIYEQHASIDLSEILKPPPSSANEENT